MKPQRGRPPGQGRGGGQRQAEGVRAQPKAGRAPVKGSGLGSDTAAGPVGAVSAARTWWRRWLPAVCLVAATILAYQPVWRAGFIWDDDVYLTQNKLLTAPDGLRRIWFSGDSPSQYFPLVYTTFRFEHALWGIRPAGYHWVNLLLHAANTLLVWRVLRRLGVPGAGLAAALFALHPVQVESVAWVTERKNVLSLFFFLLSLLAWVEFVRESQSAPLGAGERVATPGPSRGGEDETCGVGMKQAEGRSAVGGELARTPRAKAMLYALALVFYLLALFSKTTACTLPATLVLVLWLRRQPLTRLRWLQVAPFVGVGLAMGLFTMWWERHHIGTSGGVFTIGPLERLLIASHAVWFYLGKLLWPVNLMFSYPRWNVDLENPLAYSWLLPGALLCVLVYLLRGRTGRGPETALVFFVATLSPTLGFIMLFTFRYTFVADHYQYVACIGPLALAAAGMVKGFNRVEAKTAAVLRPTLSGALLLALGVLTWHQAGIYRDLETLWRDTVTRNPDSWMAHGNLGRCLMHKGRYDEAMEQYQQALRINPRDVDSLVSVGNALFGKRQFQEAAEYYEKALAVNPDNPEAHVNLAVILANRGQVDEAMAHDRQALRVNPMHVTARVNLAVMLATKGHYEEALEHYQKALEVNPNQPLTHINMAIALKGLGRLQEAEGHYRQAAAAVNGHARSLAQQGRVDEAAAQYREAIRLIPNDAEAYCGLGILLARAGQREEAQEQFRQALRLKPDYAEALQQLRALGGTDARR